MKVNIKQISEETGFSQATVSNALNGKRGVNRETQEQILETARRLGYNGIRKMTRIRFAIAHSIANEGARVVADTPFFSDLTLGVEQTARECGYETVVMNFDISDDDTIAEMKRDQTAGIILLATELSEEDMKKFDGCECPLVVIDAWFDSMKYDSVLISNTDAVCQAVKYLAAAGHKKIGYLCGSERIMNFEYREAGVLRGLRLSGLSQNPQWRIPLTPSLEGAYADMKKALEAIDTKDLPTAFFADNDFIALGAMKAMQEAGIRIPEDVSLVGFDDMPYSEISSPALTTIHVYKQEMGAVAVKRLLEHLSQEKIINTKMQVCTSFVERQSVRNLTEESI